MTDDTEYLSKEGYIELQKKLEDLKTKKRVEIAQRLEYAKSLGDLSENAEYSEAKDAQMSNEAEVAKLEDLLSRAEVISTIVTGEVRIGSTVSVQKEKNGEERFTIVGREEADPLKGRISLESPLGKAFLGKKKNDSVLVSTPRGQVQYLILEIA
ncbi:MAG: transcription elongation factor GreA [Patescibacteria group bacterium]